MESTAVPQLCCEATCRNPPFPPHLERCAVHQPKQRHRQPGHGLGRRLAPRLARPQQQRGARGDEAPRGHQQRRGVRRQLLHGHHRGAPEEERRDEQQHVQQRGGACTLVSCARQFKQAATQRRAFYCGQRMPPCRAPNWASRRSASCPEGSVLGTTDAALAAPAMDRSNTAVGRAATGLTRVWNVLLRFQHRLGLLLRAGHRHMLWTFRHYRARSFHAGANALHMRCCAGGLLRRQRRGCRRRRSLVIHLLRCCNKPVAAMLLLLVREPSQGPQQGRAAKVGHRLEPSRAAGSDDGCRAFTTQHDGNGWQCASRHSNGRGLCQAIDALPGLHELLQRHMPPVMLFLTAAITTPAAC